MNLFLKSILGLFALTVATCATAKTVSQSIGSRGAATPPATFKVTTTGAATLSIASLSVTSSIPVDWGDGTSTNYTGTGARSHDYAGAGTFTVFLRQPRLVTALTLTDNKVTLNSSNIAPIVNVTVFIIATLKAGRFDSADVTAWRPSTFNLYSMPSGYAGTFNSSDVTNWRPWDFRMWSMPAGYAGTFNSSNVAAWIADYFHLYSMPAGYGGTFNSSDLTAWRPYQFRISAMPSGYAGVFDSADVSNWYPSYFFLFSMPSSYNFTITAGGFVGWRSVSTFNLGTNSLSQSQVDQVLADFYTMFSARVAPGGTLTLNGAGNAAPSGTYEASCPPTNGLQYRYELLNDSCATNPTKKWTTVSVN